MAWFIGFIGVLFGGFVGLTVGMLGWLLFYYLVFMLPTGTHLGPGDPPPLLTLPIVLTGPIGASIGAVLGGRYFWRLGVSLRAGTVSPRASRPVLLFAMGLGALFGVEGMIEFIRGRALSAGVTGCLGWAGFLIVLLYWIRLRPRIG